LDAKVFLKYSQLDAKFVRNDPISHCFDSKLTFSTETGEPYNNDQLVSKILGTGKLKKNAEIEVKNKFFANFQVAKYL